MVKSLVKFKSKDYLGIMASDITNNHTNWQSALWLGAENSIPKLNSTCLSAAVAQLQHLAPSLNRRKKKKHKPRSKTSQVVSCHGLSPTYWGTEHVTVATKKKEESRWSMGRSAWWSSLSYHALPRIWDWKIIRTKHLEHQNRLSWSKVSLKRGKG